MSITPEKKNEKIDGFLVEPHTPHSVCTRCGGLLVNELSIDLWSCTSELGCDVRRCVQCGDIIDAVILRNRRIGLASSTHPSTATPVSSMRPQILA